MLPRAPEAIICDMDGLLVDSERLERRVWQAAAAEMGVAMTDAQFATFVGHPVDECERLLVQYYGAAFDLAAYRERRHRLMHDIVAREGVPLRPGALAWLDFVAARGIPLAVATSSAPPLVHERIGDMLHRFAAVVTRADVARGKPHPDIYMKAASLLAADPRDCLALEDSPTGARAAIAAAMPVIIVPDLVRPPDDLIPLTAGVYESLDAVREAASRAWPGSL